MSSARSSHRQRHLSERIQQKLSWIFIRKSHDPRFKHLTVCAVELSADRSYADVKIASALRAEENMPELLKTLNDASGYLQGMLSQTLRTRRTPKLRFHYDRGFDHSQRIESVLDSVQPSSREPSSPTS